jgi:hypothetical protein
LQQPSEQNLKCVSIAIDSLFVTDLPKLESAESEISGQPQDEYFQFLNVDSSFIWIII